MGLGDFTRLYLPFMMRKYVGIAVNTLKIAQNILDRKDIHAEAVGVENWRYLLILPIEPDIGPISKVLALTSPDPKNSRMFFTYEPAKERGTKKQTVLEIVHKSTDI